MQPSTSKARETGHGTTPHPQLDTWIAYHGGELPEVEERRLLNHLTGCRRCVQLLLDLADFLTVQRSEDSAPADFSKAATWRLLRNRVRPRQPPHRRWLPAAAAVLLGVLGFSGWALVDQQSELRELHSTVAALSQPQANAPIFDLRPGGSLRSRQRDAQRLLVPEGSGFTLILNLLESNPATVFEARILDASSTSVATVDGLKLDELDTLTLLVPAGWLSEGRYAVELRGAANVASTPPLESYSIEIARP